MLFGLLLFLFVWPFVIKRIVQKVGGQKIMYFPALGLELLNNVIIGICWSICYFAIMFPATKLLTNGYIVGTLGIITALIALACSIYASARLVFSGQKLSINEEKTKRLNNGLRMSLFYYASKFGVILLIALIGQFM